MTDNPATLNFSSTKSTDFAIGMHDRRNMATFNRDLGITPYPESPTATSPTATATSPTATVLLGART